MAEKMSDTVVYTEIPATDLDRAMNFYGGVFNATLTRNDMGPNPMADLPRTGESSVSGHIYPGKPAARGEGPTIHFASPCSLADAMTRVWDSGGEVVSEVIEIPSGKFFYAVDTEGNSIGFYKA